MEDQIIINGNDKLELCAEAFKSREMFIDISRINVGSIGSSFHVSEVKKLYEYLGEQLKSIGEL